MCRYDFLSSLKHILHQAFIFEPYLTDINECMYHVLYGDFLISVE